MSEIARLIRHLLAILLLPVMVVVVLPRWLLTADLPDFHWSGASLGAASRGLGALVFLAGFALFAWCVVLFARVGQGTLAPWDPTQALVAQGPYAYVRNPMISGVAGMLLGEALFFRSALVAGWFALFVLINHVYFIWSEEPGLLRRFGAGYAEYQERVPRWLPGRKR